METHVCHGHYCTLVYFALILLLHKTNKKRIPKLERISGRRVEEAGSTIANLVSNSIIVVTNENLSASKTEPYPIDFKLQSGFNLDVTFR